MTNQLDRKNELQLSNDLTTITAEVNSYKQVAGQSIFEIGRRLKHVKENDLVHGEFGKWLESVNIENSQARRFMKVADELNSNRGTYHEIGLRALYEIATMSEEERSKPHELKNGETKTVDDMTVKELQEVKRKLKEAENHNKLVEEELESERFKRELTEHQLKAEQDKKNPVVETKTIEKIIEVDKTDYNAINEAKDEALKLQEKLDKKIGEINTLEEIINQESPDAEAHRKLKEEMKMLKSQHGDMFRRFEAAKEFGNLLSEAEDDFMRKYSGLKFSKLFKESSNSPVLLNAYEEFRGMIEDWLIDLDSGFSKGRKGSFSGDIIEATIIESEAKAYE